MFLGSAASDKTLLDPISFNEQNTGRCVYGKGV